jgi:hypothetical protein
MNNVLVFLKEEFYIAEECITFIHEKSTFLPFMLISGGKKNSCILIEKNLLFEITICQEKCIASTNFVFDTGNYDKKVLMEKIQTILDYYVLCACNDIFNTNNSIWDNTKCYKCISIYSSGQITTSDDNCCICYEALNTNMVKRICPNDHMLHLDCIRQLCSSSMFNNTCPICRSRTELFTHLPTEWDEDYSEDDNEDGYEN